MYIDTCLSEELINNTSQTIGLSIDTLLDAYIKSNIDCHEGKSHDLERAMNQFFVIISRFSENISKINEVCLHHISRRLEGSDNGNNSCLGLHELLTEDNLFSRFLLDFGIEFKKSNIGILIIKDGKYYGVNPRKDARLYTRLLHQNMRSSDTCVNGFLFGDHLDSISEYYQDLRKAPEFIRDLAKFLNMPEIVNKYNDSSNCYRLTYRVPLEQVIIDNKDDYEIEKKTFQLLFLIFERYFETIRNKKRYVKIFTNPLLRIKEGLSIDDNSLICKTMLE